MLQKWEQDEEKKIKLVRRHSSCSGNRNVMLVINSAELTLVEVNMLNMT
jgi:hypothetical protein